MTVVRALVAVPVVMLAACAAPSTYVEGDEDLVVRTRTWSRAQAAPYSPGQLSVPDEVKMAQCVLRNDKGTWNARSFEAVRVTRSHEPLVVECEHEGFPSERVVVPCISPRQKSQAVNGFVIGRSLALIPLALLVPPLAIAAAVPLAGASVISGATMGPNPDLCGYGDVWMILTPRWP